MQVYEGTRVRPILDMAVEVWVSRTARETDTRFIFTCVNLEQHQAIFGTRYQPCDRIITSAFLDIAYLIT